MRKVVPALVLLASILGGGVALAQDSPPPPEPAKKDDAKKVEAPKKDDAPPPKKDDAPPKKEEPKKPEPEAKKGPRPPEPGENTTIGEVLAPNTVARANLYPLEEGRRWTYDLKVWLESAQESGKDESPALLADAPRAQRLDVRVGESQKVEGKDAAVLDSLLEGELIQRQFFSVEDGKIGCMRRVQGVGDHAKDNTLTPPQPILEKDLAVGAKWTWQGKIGGTTGKTTYEVLREEKITVKAGTYACLVIRATVEAEDESRGVRLQWLSPGVGLVREETKVRTPGECWRTLGELLKSEGPVKRK